MITKYPGGSTTIKFIPESGEYIRRFGTNAAVGTSFVNVDNIGAVLPHMPSTSTKFEVVSTSVNDTAAGSGARTIEITGINTSWQLQVETLTMNGTTSVQSVNNYFRVTKANVITVGSYGGSNIGDILVRVTGGGTSFVQIAATKGQSFSSHFCVPLGYRGFISGSNLSTDSGKTVSLKVQSRAGANNVAAPFSAVDDIQYFDDIGGVQHFDYEIPIPLLGATDVIVTAKTKTGTASVSFEYWGWIEKI
jgi:hypothetical protein